MSDGVPAADRGAAAPPFAMTGGVVRRDGREVLSGVDLRVGAGDVLAILGPNGAGTDQPSTGD